MARPWVVTVVAAVLVMTACSDDGGSEAPVAGERPSTTTAPAGNGTTSPDPSAPGPSGGSGSAGFEQESFAAPAAGTYEYRLQRERGEASTTQLVIEPLEPGDALARQHHTFAFENQARVMEWSAGSVALIETQAFSDPRYGGAGYTCDWEPATTVVLAPLEVGREWTSQATCSFAVDGEEATHEATEHREVTDRRDATVNGRPVEIVEIRRSATVVASGPVSFRQTVEAIDHYAIATGLLVHTEAVVSLEQGGRTASAAILLDLVALDPTR